MSTKNLARTVIEGGRRQESKDVRRDSTKDIRSRQRRFISRVRQDPEFAYEFEDFDKKWSGTRYQDDKLGPVQRWLKKQIGKPWAETFSKLSKAFDPRNVAQRHVVHDHMLNKIRGAGTRESIYRHYDHCDYYIDEDGILRETNRRWRFRHVYQAKGLYVTPEVLKEFTGDRKVIERGKILYWGEPTGLNAYMQVNGYRQTIELTLKEKKFYNSLRENLRESIRWGTP